METRLKICCVIIILFFTGITARLFNLQILTSEKYKIQARQQHEGRFSIPASRGIIYSSDGFPLVANKTSWLLYGEPKKISNPETAASSLKSIIDIDESKTADILKSDLFWVALKHHISQETREKIEALSLSGIGFEKESTRFYPENDLGKQFFGFVGSNEQGQDQGYFGLEGFYNDDLSGRAGYVLQEIGAFGEPILTGGYNKIPPLNGRDLVLTINRDIQFLLEKHLKSGVEKFGAESGTGIIMDPKTGAILAMADHPLQATPSAFLNRAISETFEPGSVMKAVTMSAAINENAVKPQTTMLDSGPVVYSGHTVDNWNSKHHGEETMIEILQHSNNIGAAWVGHQLGSKKLRQYFIKFGFGEILRIDLEGESTGIVKPLNEWRDIDLATAAFGQGISVTPLQMLSALSTIANNGEYCQPYLVSSIRDSLDSDNSYNTQSKARKKRVLQKSKAGVIEEMLTAAVSGGEGKFAIIKNYKIAGKTGTAQIPVEGVYDPTKTNAAFMGFLPSSKKFAMLIRLEKPTASHWASETAEPLWMDIAQDLIHYYGIKPDY
jgi:cell division protein FtsI/penicillin-binding protein 2